MPCDDCRAREAEVERWTAHANKYEALALTLDNDKAALKAENERLNDLVVDVAFERDQLANVRLFALRLLGGLDVFIPRVAAYLDMKDPLGAIDRLDASTVRYSLSQTRKQAAELNAALAPVDAPPVRVVRSKEWWMEKARAEEGTPAAGMLARDPVDAPAVECICEMTGVNWGVVNPDCKVHRPAPAVEKEKR